MKEKQKLSVVGLGYVGLPLALLAAKKGWHVLGLDSSKEKVSLINAGKSPIKDTNLQEQLKTKPITASTDPATIAAADIVVVAVPTPVIDDHLPDLGPLKNAIKSIRPYLKPGQVLIVESTINPGVMDEVIVPLLKKRKDLKLDDTGEEQDVLHVIHCPERINPGDKKWTVGNIPRVLGGYTNTGTKKAKQFYSSIIDAEIKIMRNIAEAEAVKILENTFRDMNIAFVNEMAMSFSKLGIDVKNVIEGASSKPFAFLPHYPSNGVGGHCISVDPYYMIERGKQAGFNHKFLKLAREINEGMPKYTVELMEESVKQLKLENYKVALLGLTYKKNIDDLRESPALDIQEILQNKNINIDVYDPYVKKLSTVQSLDEALENSDVVMLATDHDEFTENLTPEKLTKFNIKLVIDGKNSLDADKIAEAGIRYVGIGRFRDGKSC